jgi:hypothetical protein
MPSTSIGLTATRDQKDRLSDVALEVSRATRSGVAIRRKEFGQGNYFCRDIAVPRSKILRALRQLLFLCPRRGYLSKIGEYFSWKYGAGNIVGSKYPVFIFLLKYPASAPSRLNKLTSTSCARPKMKDFVCFAYVQLLAARLAQSVRASSAEAQR